MLFKNILHTDFLSRVEKSPSAELKKGNNTGPKLQWSTQKASSMSWMHGTSLLSTLGQFGPVLLP